MFKTNITKSPSELGAAAAAASVRIVALWTILLGLAVFKGVLVFLDLPLDLDDPLYLAQSAMRVGLAGFPLSILRTMVVMAFGWLGCQWLENSSFGQRVRENKAVLYGAVFIAAALAFGGGR